VNERRINEAIEVAIKAHGTQTRKGSDDVPYVVHPWGVSLLLKEFGCTENELIAGILHDVIEDTELEYNNIRELFGTEVANIVDGCSEEDTSAPWMKRKQSTIKRLNLPKAADTPAINYVVCADKIHNLRSTKIAMRTHGDEVWERFNSKKEDQEWYYKEVYHAIKSHAYTYRLEKLLEKLHTAIEDVFGEWNV